MPHGGAWRRLADMSRAAKTAHTSTSPITHAAIVTAPKCQAGAAKTWLAAREAELLPVRYFHLVFTLPKPIANIAHQNKREIYNLLMRASADTVIKIAADPKHLGARAGMISVLHTWGSAMTHHPHVHMVAPGGGLSTDGSKWISSRKNFFLSVRVLSRLYRRLILEGLTRLHKAGKLRFFGDLADLADKAAFKAFPQTNAQNQLGRLRQRTFLPGPKLFSHIYRDTRTGWRFPTAA